MDGGWTRANSGRVWGACCRMPCRWHEKSIVVLDHVIITEPYSIDNCKSNDQKALSRVRKVVCLRLFLYFSLCFYT